MLEVGDNSADFQNFVMIIMTFDIFLLKIPFKHNDRVTAEPKKYASGSLGAD